MHFIKFMLSVTGSAAAATAVLALLVKTVHVIQTKGTIAAAAKALFR